MPKAMTARLLKGESICRSRPVRYSARWRNCGSCGRIAASRQTASTTNMNLLIALAPKKERSWWMPGLRRRAAPAHWLDQHRADDVLVRRRRLERAAQNHVTAIDDLGLARTVAAAEAVDPEPAPPSGLGEAP